MNRKNELEINGLEKTAVNTPRKAGFQYLPILLKLTAVESLR